MAEIDPSAYAYDVAVLDQRGRLLHLPHGSLVWEEQPDELAPTLSCHFPDVQTTEGPMGDLVQAGTPAYLFLVKRGPSGAPAIGVQSASFGAAWDPFTGGTPGGFGGGGERTELLRGTVVKVGGSSDSVDLEAHIADNLTMLLKHDIDAHVDAGTPAQDALSGFLTAWGLELGQYDGPDVELPDMTWRGETAGKLVQDILDQGVRQGAGRFTLRSSGTTVDVIAPGGNQPVYWLRPALGAGRSQYGVDIADMVSAVILKTETASSTITAQDEDLPQASSPVPGSVRTDGAAFDGAVRFIHLEASTDEAVAALQAKQALAEHGFPTWSFEHETIDVPAVRKWHRIRITDRKVDGRFLVEGVSHDASAGKMRLQLTTPEDFARKTQLLEVEAQLDILKATQEEEKQPAAAASGGGGGVAAIDKVTAQYMGSPYVWGGKTAGNWDCSGFAFWLAGQLGAPLPGYAFTDSIAANTALVAKNSQNGAAVGDFVLYWDGGITQPGAMYPHVAVWIGPGQVIEQGGTAHNLHKGGFLGGYSYEIRRSQPLYEKLNRGKA